jgi:hypothetical protein
MNHYVNYMPSRWIENFHERHELLWVLSRKDDRLLVCLPLGIPVLWQGKHASEDARFTADEHPLMDPIEPFANLGHRII